MPRDKEKYNAWFREYYKKNKQAYFAKAARMREKVCAKIDEIKHEQGCKFCQERDPVCLDFHHLDEASKEKSVSRWAKSSSLKKALEEIGKCICVCANCHRKIHAGKILVKR